MKPPTVRESIKAAVDTLSKRKSNTKRGSKGNAFRMLPMKGPPGLPVHWAIVDKDNKIIATAFTEKQAKLIIQRLNY